MNPLNSSTFRHIGKYLHRMTWERGMVLLFSVLIVCEVGMFLCARLLYEKLSEKVPVYINCNEVSREKQMEELRNYIASSTEKTKPKPKASKKAKATSSKSKSASTTQKSIKKGTP